MTSVAARSWLTSDKMVEGHEPLWACTVYGQRKPTRMSSRHL